MTSIKIFFDENKDMIYGFEAIGHTNYAQHGEDVVCSAISILTQTAIYGLTEVAQLQVRHTVKDAHVFCMIPSTTDQTKNIQAQAILRTMYIGLIQIRDEYSKYIRIIEKRRCN